MGTRQEHERGMGDLYFTPLGKSEAPFNLVTLVPSDFQLVNPFKT